MGLLFTLPRINERTCVENSKVMLRDIRCCDGLKTIAIDGMESRGLPGDFYESKSGEIGFYSSIICDVLLVVRGKRPHMVS